MAAATYAVTSWLLLLAAGVLLFIALWIVVPAPTLPLLVFGVGAPELSPLLLVAALTIGVLAAFSAAAPLNRGAVVLTLVAAALFTIPLLRLPGAIRRFDQAFRG